MSRASTVNGKKMERLFCVILANYVNIFNFRTDISQLFVTVSRVISKYFNKSRTLNHTKRDTSNWGFQCNLGKFFKVSKI